MYEITKVLLHDPLTGETTPVDVTMEVEDIESTRRTYITSHGYARNLEVYFVYNCKQTTDELH
jgi:hypothetical protein